MKPGLRRFFFFAYTIFFVALTPLLILVSLGYDINFEDWELTPTLKVEVKSLPRSSEVFYSNQKVFDTPGEAKVLGDKIVDISIRARGFVEEEFQLWSKQRKNEAVSIDSLAMLPLESEVLENFDDQKAITLFSDGFVLLKQNQEYFVSSFSFGGVESQINKVVNIEKKTIDKGRWERVDNGVYFKKDQQLLMYNLKGVWYLEPINEIDYEVESLELLNQTEVVFLNTRQEIWSYNLNTKLKKFVDSGYQGIDSSVVPNRIWLSKNSNIYEVNREGVTSDDFVVDIDNLYLNHVFDSHTNPKLNLDFKALNVSQGLVFLQDGVLVFVPDFDRQKWYVMADKVEKVDSFGQTVFWLDDQRVLWDYNFSLRDLDRVGQIGYSGETTDVEMEYYSPWKRLFVYTDDEVYSIWKDNGTDNEAILQYSIVRWVNGFFAKMR